jgi:citrate lyase subunit beta / citryl-CoA lyase
MTERAQIFPRPLRSVLFVPGHRQRWIAPARASGADGIIFDLEDAVPVAEIKAARSVVREAIEVHGESGPALIVRVGPAGSEALDADLDAVVCAGLAGVAVPLVSTAEEIKAVAGRLDELEAGRGIPVGSTVIWPIVETALAARFAFEIASASDRVAYMGGGTSRQGDIARSLGFVWSAAGSETMMLRSWVLLNVRAAGVPFPVSGMWSVIDDLAGLRAFAEQSRSLGYAGLMAIHPTHIPVINEVFTPTSEEIERWEEVIRTMREAQADGIGAIRMYGQLVDEADIKTAEVGLEYARRFVPIGNEE